MAVETPADLAVLFSAEDFGQSATYTVAGGSGVGIEGIFTNAHADVAPLDGRGISTVTPVFTVATLSLPPGAAQGDVLETGGSIWRVADLQPDGTGLTRIILEG